MKKNNSKLAHVLFLLTIIILAGKFQISAQEAVPTPTPSEEETKLQEEIRVLELRAKKAEAEAKLVNAVVKPTATPLSGSATFSDTDRLSMEVEVRSYRAMRTVTDNVACDVRKNTPSGENKIVIFRAEDYAAWRNYELLAPTLKKQISDLKTEYIAWLTNNAVADLRKNKDGNTDLHNKINIQGSPAGGEGGAPALLSGLTAVTSTVAGITNTVKSFADLMAIFRSDVTFANKEVTINPEALKSSLSKSFTESKSNTNCMNNSKFTIYDPANFAPASDANGAFSSPILNDIRELIEMQRSAAIKIALFEVVDGDLKKIPELEQKYQAAKSAKNLKDAEMVSINKQLAAAKADKKTELVAALEKANAERIELQKAEGLAENTLTNFNNSMSRYKDQHSVENRVRISRLRALNTETSKFITDFTQSSNNSGSILSQYVKAENLAKVLEGNNAFWLRINAVKSGGNTRVQKNLFRYFYKPDIKHSGGAIIEYSLTDKQGAVIVANTDTVYLKYAKSSNVDKP